MKLTIQVFWDVAPYRLVNIYACVGENIGQDTANGGKMYVRNVGDPTSRHGETSQKVWTFVSTALRTSNLADSTLLQTCGVFWEGAFRRHLPNFRSFPVITPPRVRLGVIITVTYLMIIIIIRRQNRSGGVTTGKIRPFYLQMGGSWFILNVDSHLTVYIFSHHTIG